MTLPHRGRLQLVLDLVRRLTRPYLSAGLLAHLSLSVMLPPIRFSYGFAMAAILSKSLSVADYGDWSLFIANIGLVLTFSSFNLMYASSIKLTGKPPAEQRQDIFRIGLFKMIATQVIFVGFATYLYYGDVFSGEVLLCMAGALFFRTIADMVYGFLRALLEVKRQVGFLLFESLVILTGIAINVFLLWNTLVGAMIAFTLAEVLAAGVGLFLLRNNVAIVQWHWPTVREYMRIGLPLIPFSFSDLIVNALVPLLLKLQSGSEDVAMYSIAQKVALIATIPNALVENVYAQYLKNAKLERGGAGVRATFGLFLLIYLAVALPLLGLMYCFGDRVILLVSTPEYLSTHGLMMLLMIVNGIIMLTAMVTTVFAVYNRTRSVGLLWIAVLVLLLGLAWYLAGDYGTIGVAYALIIAFGVGLVVATVGAFRLSRPGDKPTVPTA